MSAWGKTGRVAIRSGSTRGVYNDIHVDGEHVGNADHLPLGWQARAFDGGYGSCADAASLDAAVLWVLRRVDPALWRQERGEVWTVRKLGRRGNGVFGPWHIHRGPGTPRRFENCGCEDDLHEDSAYDHADAVRTALAYSSRAAVR